MALLQFYHITVAQSPIASGAEGRRMWGCCLCWGASPGDRACDVYVAIVVSGQLSVTAAAQIKERGPVSQTKQAKHSGELRWIDSWGLLAVGVVPLSHRFYWTLYRTIERYTWFSLALCFLAFVSNKFTRTCLLETFFSNLDKVFRIEQSSAIGNRKKIKLKKKTDREALDFFFYNVRLGIESLDMKVSGK